MKDNSAMRSRIAEIIAAYDAQGIHRTGTSVDGASAAWLASQLEQIGASATRDDFKFKRVTVRDARLDAGDLQIPGVPLFDCNYTGPEGIAGTLGAIGSDSSIGMAMIPPAARGDEYDRIIRARELNGHQAIVLVTAAHMPPDGVATINAEAFARPFGPPVLQVPNKDWAALQERITARSTASVIVHCEYVDATASNVQATIPGRDPSLAPVVVMTPRSGWWHCASERGGGIAAWLEIARSAVEQRPLRTVIFTANTGHELGHTGLDHFLEAHPGLVERAHLWIHLGANFAAKQGSGVRLQFATTALRAEMMALAKSAGVVPASETPVSMRPFGEARNIFDGGGRYVSILGSNGLFHHPADRYPAAVDLDVTAQWTRVLVAMVMSAGNQ